MPPKRRGFATLTPDKHKEISSRGGQKRGIIKGTATLSPEERKERASSAAKIRWSKVHAERQGIQVE